MAMELIFIVFNTYFASVWSKTTLVVLSMKM